MVDRIGQKPQGQQKPQAPWDGSTQVDSEGGAEDFYSANPQQQRPGRQSAFVIPDLNTGATLSVNGASADAGNPAVRLSISAARLKALDAYEKNGKVKSASELIGLTAQKLDLNQKIAAAKREIAQQEDADKIEAAANLRETKRGEDAVFVTGAVDKLRKLLPEDFPEERAQALIEAAATMETPESARAAMASGVTAWRQEKKDAAAEQAAAEKRSISAGKRKAGIQNVWSFAATEFGVPVGENGPDWASAISDDDMEEIGRYAAQVAGGTMSSEEARTIITNMATESVTRQQARAVETGSQDAYKGAGEREGRLSMSQSRRAAGLVDEFEAWSEENKPKLQLGLADDVKADADAKWTARQSDKMNSLLRKWGLRPTDRIMESVRDDLDSVTGATPEEKAARIEAARNKPSPMDEFLAINAKVNTPEGEARAKEVRAALEARPAPLEFRIELFRKMFGDTSPGGLDLFHPGGVDPAFAHKPGMEKVIAAQEANLEEEMSRYGITPETSVADIRKTIESLGEPSKQEMLTVLRGQFVESAYAPVFRGVPWAMEKLAGSEGREMAEGLLAEGRRQVSGQNEMSSDAYARARRVLEGTPVGRAMMGTAGFAGTMLNIGKGSAASEIGRGLASPGFVGALPATLATYAAASGQGSQGVAEALAFGTAASAASKAFGAWFGKLNPKAQGAVAQHLRGRGAHAGGFAAAGTLLAGLKGEELADAQRILLDVAMGGLMSGRQAGEIPKGIKPRIETLNERVDRFKQEYRAAWAESRRGPDVTILNETPNASPPRPALGGGPAALPSGAAEAPAQGGPAGLPGAPGAPGLPTGGPALGRGAIPLKSRLPIQAKSGLPIEMGPGTPAPAAAKPRSLRSRVKPKPVEVEAAPEADFVGSLPEGARARAQAALDYGVATRGGMTRRQLVDTQVEEGAYLEGEGADRRLVTPDGRSVGQKTLTKTGMDYAQHLLETARPKADAGASAPDRVRSIQMGEVAPHEMTRDEFSRGEDLPVAGPGEVILYHRLRSPDQLPSVLEHGLDIGRKGKMSEGPRGVMWYATEPTGYSDSGTVVGVRVPKSDVDMRNYGSGQAAMGRSARPDEIVYVDSPTSSSKSTPSKRVGFERSGEYANQYHETYVEDALKAGETVPPNVLKDYPELAAKYGKPPAPAAPSVHGGGTTEATWAVELTDPNGRKSYRAGLSSEAEAKIAAENATGDLRSSNVKSARPVRVHYVDGRPVLGEPPATAATKPVVTLGRPKRQGSGDPQRHGIAEFTRRQGGFRDERHYRGEIDRVRSHPFMVRKEGGPARSLSDATADAIESGYLPKGSTPSEFLDAVEADLRGESTFSDQREPTPQEQFPEEREAPTLEEFDQQYESMKEGFAADRADAVKAGDKARVAEIDQLAESEAEYYKRGRSGLEEYLAEQEPVTNSRKGPKSLRSRLDPKIKPSRERGAVNLGDAIDVAARSARATGRGLREGVRQIGRAFMSRYESLRDSGPGGKVASSALRLVEHKQDALRGSWRRPYEAAVETAGDKKNRSTMLGMMRPTREPNSNFGYLDFRRKYEGKAPASPEEKVILDKFRNYIYGTLGDAAQKAGLTGFVNRPDRLPNIHSQRYHQILRAGPVKADGTPVPEWKAIEDMYTQQPEIGTRDNARDYMFKLRTKLSDEGSGALDREAMFEQKRHLENLPAWAYTKDGKAIPVTETNPINIIERMHEQGSKRLGFVEVLGQKGPKGSPPRLLDQIRNQVIRDGGNINLFEDMVRASQGGRLVSKAGESGGFNFMESSPGRITKAASTALKGSALGRAWLMAVGEPAGPALEVFGPVNLLDATVKSFGRSFSERFMGKGEDPQIAKLRDNDVLRKRTPTSLLSRGSKTDTIVEGLERFTDVELQVNLLDPVSRVNNYTNYAIAGDNWLDGIKKNPGGKLTQAKNAASLRVYATLTDAQAKQMAAGNFNDAQKYAALRQITRNMSGQDQSKLAKSGVEVARASKMVAFINYATTQVRTEGRWVRQVGEAAANFNKPGGKVNFTMTMYGWMKHLALRGVQGAGASLIAHLMHGGDMESYAKRWVNNPKGEAFNAITTSMFAGSYGTIAANFLRENLTADDFPKAVGSAAVNAIWAYGVTRDIWNASAGKSQFRGMGVAERTKALALRYTPQVKLAGAVTDMLALSSDQSQEASDLVNAKRELNLYRYGTGVRNYAKFRTGDEDLSPEEREAKDEFRDVIARVARGVREGDSKEDVQNDFMEASKMRSPKSAAASLRSRFIIGKGAGDTFDRFGQLNSDQRRDIIANLKPDSPWFAKGVTKKSIRAILKHDARLNRLANWITSKD